MHKNSAVSGRARQTPRSIIGPIQLALVLEVTPSPSKLIDKKFSAFECGAIGFDTFGLSPLVMPRDDDQKRALAFSYGEERYYLLLIPISLSRQIHF